MHNVMKTTTNSSPDAFNTLQLGVWRVLIEKELPFDPAARWRSFTDFLPLVRRLVVDVYKLGPGLFFMACFSQIWSYLEDILLLHLSNRILTIVSGVAV